jgi:hypothetical protein
VFANYGYNININFELVTLASDGVVGYGYLSKFVDSSSFHFKVSQV